MHKKKKKKKERRTSSRNNINKNPSPKISNTRCRGGGDMDACENHED
jgi:hypothetical protein